VAEYGETRTFAIERIQILGVTAGHCEPRALPPEPFANSLGVFSGSPEPVEIEFDARCADFVREREWHRSQEIVEGDNGERALRAADQVRDAPRDAVYERGHSLTLTHGMKGRSSGMSQCVRTERRAHAPHFRERRTVMASRFSTGTGTCR
jgi:hypothetical protein